MTQQQGVRLASRAISIYLFAWAISAVFDLPHEIISVQHSMRAAAVPREGMPMGLESTTVYLLRVYVAYLAATVTRIIVWLLAARWFYACGPWIQSFFNAGMYDKVEEEPSLS